jgi:cytochrome d ubiquinol oxidase subunit I
MLRTIRHGLAGTDDPPEISPDQPEKPLSFAY